MPTQTQTKTAANEAEAAAEQIREVNEQVLDFGRRAGGTFLDAYETTVKAVADYQDKVADSSPIDWLGTVGHAQANLTREVGKVYASTARELLK